jgi:cytochrome c peroxidase
MTRFRIGNGLWLPWVVGLVFGSSVACKRTAPEAGSGENQTAPKAAESTKAKLVVPRPALPTLPDSALNPSTPEKISLGQRLFFDPALSVDGSVACYSCHKKENGTGGAIPIAIGAKQQKLTRHSPTLWNVGYLPALYWDGRSPTLEAQALAAWAGGNMGVGKENLEKKAEEISSLPRYKAGFAAAFPGAKTIGPDQVVQALSAYERTLVCNDTAYDKFAAGNEAALSADAKAGLELFEGKAMCVACHAPPHFTSAAYGQGVYYNIGVGIEGVPEDKVDVGRMKVSKEEKDWAAFRPPPLRNVAKSAPYFHDGHVATLKEAVKFMASGGYDNKNKTSLLIDRKLSDAELGQLVTFLEALTCPGELTPPKPE